jgi:hypothetical protein
MPQSIVDFIGSFKNDVAKPSRFEVSIEPRNLVGLTPLNTSLTYRCETAELPSKTYSTLEQKFGSNPIEKYPYQVQFNDLSLTFIVSGDMSEKKFFDSWMEKISPSSSYNMQYKDQYTASITIRQFNSLNQATYAIELIDAYPITVNQLDLDWSSEGYHKLTVVFAYTYWEPSLNLNAEPTRTNTLQPSQVTKTVKSTEIENKTPGASVSKISIEGQDLNRTPGRVGPNFTPLIR